MTVPELTPRGRVILAIWERLLGFGIHARNIDLRGFVWHANVAGVWIPVPELLARPQAYIGGCA
jgi:hypothetical protein